MPEDSSHRLPRNVIPSHYDLTLEPDLASATFRGSVAVDITIVEPTNEIVVNGAELTVAEAWLVAGDGERIQAEVQLDPARQRIVFHPPTRLPPGPWRLDVDFAGSLRDDLQGFYRSTYRDALGREHVLATTQFEATSARFAFPCWDEPDRKATFAVTLVVPEGLLAVSCGATISDEPVGDGRRRVEFATTMVMSTYLLAFVVGPLEASDPVDVDGTPLRVVHVPGKADMARFALEFGAFALRFLSDFYEIRYPGDKLDLLAIPDFASGAMENMGAVTFRETDLLVDPASATQAEVIRVAEVVAHEIAHMWFGNLVTMAWWNGLWLKEAFARFMESVVVDAYRPDWRPWSAFAAARNVSMATDGLQATRPIEYPVESPSEADGMFDVITYGKGAGVLHMLQQFLGEETFRRGITRYLRTHAHGNTETRDLWAALEAESGEPVREIMEPWVLQGGHPRIDVRPIDGGYRLSQQRFLYAGDSGERWPVPMLYEAGGAVHRLVIDDPVDIGADSIILNVGGAGYYRTRYVGNVHEAVITRLGDLPAEQRFVLLADAWAGVLAGDTSAPQFLELIATRPEERDPDIWDLMLGGIAELDRIVASDVRPALQAFVRRLLADVTAELGWVPGASETPRDRRLRGTILDALGVLGGATEIIEQARATLDDALDPKSGLDGEVASAVLSIVSAHGDAQLRRRLVDAYRRSDDAQHRRRYLQAFTAVPDRRGAEETLAMVLDGRIRSQDAMRVVAQLIGHRAVGAHMWEQVKDAWDDLMALMPPAWHRLVAAQIHHRSEPAVAADIHAWLETHPVHGGAQYFAQRLEQLDIRVRLREREYALTVPGPG